MAIRAKKILLPLAFLAISVVVTLVLVGSRSTVERVVVEPPAPLVRVRQARSSQERLLVRSRGEVRPATAATLVVEVPGKVLWVSEHFQGGGFFRKGMPLLRLDRSSYELALIRARAEESRSNVRLIQVKAEAEIAIQEWSELGRGEASPLARREPQIQEAEAILQAAEAARREAELNLSRTEIRAPYAGRIRTKLADLGQFLGAGQGVAAVYGIETAEVHLPVLDRDLAFLELPLDSAVQEGPLVELVASFAGQERRWAGRIVRTEGEINPSTRMVGLIAEIQDPYGRRVEGTEAPLTVGLFVEAEIQGKVAQVIRLPREALRKTGPGAEQVLVVKDDGRLEFRDVVVLQRTAEEILIREGLVEGEWVCVSPMEAPVDGMEVRTVQEDSEWGSPS